MTRLLLTKEQSLSLHLSIEFIEQQIHSVLPSLGRYRIEATTEGNSLRLTFVATHAEHTLKSHALLNLADSTSTVDEKCSQVASGMLRILKYLRSDIERETVENQ